ncbi:MAG: hypothetical protein NTX80_02595, partial [Candidatus Saccharibacteria bacterium]|nr:hypothetical protein [Candidatus Saccharibacteria bacterium]
YVFKSNDVPEYNPKDFVGYEWIKPEELVTRLENGELSKKKLIVYHKAATSKIARFSILETAHLH